MSITTTEDKAAGAGAGAGADIQYKIVSYSPVHTVYAEIETPIAQLALYRDGTFYMRRGHEYLNSISQSFELEFNLSWRGDWNSNMEQIRVEEGWDRISRIWAAADEVAEPEINRVKSLWESLVPQLRELISELRPQVEELEKRRLAASAEFRRLQQAKDEEKKRVFRETVKVGSKLKSWGKTYTVTAINGDQYTFNICDQRGRKEETKTIEFCWIWSYQILSN